MSSDHHCREQHVAAEALLALSKECGRSFHHFDLQDCPPLLSSILLVDFKSVLLEVTRY